MSRALAMVTSRGGRATSLALLLIVLISFPGWGGDYWIRILTGVTMWAALALSWNVIGGYGGYISFGHVAFFGIGAYTTALLMKPGTGWNFFATLPAAGLVAAAVAVIVGWPVLKLRGAYFAIATWALAEAVAQIANGVSFTGGSSGMSLPINASTSFFYYAMLVACVLSFGLCYFLLERSRFGYRLKAVRDHEVAAGSFGINTTAVKLQAFALSAVIPGVLGGIYAYWITFINPASVLDGSLTDQMVVMALVGGLGRISGPALGATLLYLINQQFLASFGDTTSYIAVVGALVALIVLFRPDGLVSLFTRGDQTRLVWQLLGRAIPRAKPSAAGGQGKTKEHA